MKKKWRFALYIGFFAGLIWGAVRWLAYFLKFTKVPPAFWLEPFLAESVVRSPLGHWSGYGVFVVFSILASLLYSLLFIRLRGPWPGIVYGFGWWTVIFSLVGCPLFGLAKWFTGPDAASLFTEAGMFILWGVFIGYSIAFEFHDERIREPEAA